MSVSSSRWPRPKVIYLDAFGTLFGVKSSVGDLYSQLAHSAGVESDPQAVNQAFYQSFAAAERLAFPEASPADIPALEYHWWKAIVAQTFEQVGVIDRFEDFDTFFATLYNYFETSDPWHVYADTPSSLRRWQSMGIELGVISNFDSRLHRVLSRLGLDTYFQSVTLSTEVGAAKPSPKIFQVALAKHNCTAQQAWHVGDSEAEDYVGAKAIGMRAVLVLR
ncbi:haloacid dehalogenase-like hydrolase, putative [Synechococcus sp. PCC 7335]|uniref:HAD-IA family hydrolase n=1 Tax=Synechococcus sp. (strain ATCC 29403 / PCC 7335) TaxID=91464 RepID=UPI00017ECB35|nr:HAD-IA family hydrolase [Synechococcus sp. PCC 7335]EDX84144.1 haloacid dehalogenase-like hydrolase, putative [Synechococcus sp. PCC 7335]